MMALERVAGALVLLVLCAVSIVRVARPPQPLPASVPDSVFSAERALPDVEQIARRPHPMGTADHDRVRDYLVARLTTLGLTPEIQRTTAIGTRYQQAGRVQNVLARLRGTAAGSRAVLVMVHYDGVEAGPAAGDDAAGCAALLETLRALRRQEHPLTNDVIALFTDGEESGLLGAAAFAREHPWAKDVDVVLNFEARGTTGRSFMFETGRGNLDVARALRHAPDASAGSVYATVYRTLPNDTDLSEIAILGVPALNFAFADGVERYHTSRDDLAHLDRGSLQHHGSQMLRLTRVFGREPLPRARTSDAVFFDLPFVGLVVYPQAFEMPLALFAAVLVVMLIIRDRHRVAFGVLTALLTLVVSGVIGWFAGRVLSGPAMWSNRYAAAIVLLALSATAACTAGMRRWTTPRGVHVGAMVVWLALALFFSIRAPGVGYLFTWPLLFAAGAELLSRGRDIARWAAAAAALIILAGFSYGVSVVMLGLAGAGAIALTVVTALVALLLVPLLTWVSHNQPWRAASWLLGGAAVCLVWSALTVRANADHPVRSALMYAQHADSVGAWLGTAARSSDSWSRNAIAPAIPGPAWVSRAMGSANRFRGRKVVSIPIGAPSATLIGDAVQKGMRRLVLRVNAPPGTTALQMRASGASVLASAMDGRAVDTARYRRPSREWVMQYWAVPDSGAVVALSIPAGARLEFELVARRPGIPPEIVIPPRPPEVAPSQTGDATLIYWRGKF